MRIEIDTTDQDLVAEIMGEMSMHIGDEATVPGGALTYDGTTVRKSVGFDTVALLLNIASSAAVNLFSDWLYDKLKGRATTVRIEGVEVDINGKSIAKTVEEQSEQSAG